MAELGERVAALDARFAEFQRYNHERWHKLDNDLQPLFLLPERLTRDVGRMQGIFDGKIGTVSKELERAVESAIEKAIEPINAEVRQLRGDVDALQAVRAQQSGARMLGVWILQTLIAAASAFAAILTMGAKGP